MGLFIFYPLSVFLFFLITSFRQRIELIVTYWIKLFFTYKEEVNFTHNLI